MRRFMAAPGTETNTFSPIPTGHAAFRESWFRNDGSRHSPENFNIPLIAWRGACEADGHELVESVCTFAQPAGITVRRMYEELRGILLADLEAAAPADVVLLAMHGAMVAQGYDDCEGDTSARVRQIVGPDAVVGLSSTCIVTSRI